MTSTPAPRLRRSILYVPGSSSKALAKVASLPADGFILDLEDAVVPEAKAAARDAVAALVAGGQFGRREIVVRVNGLDTPWFADDVAMAARCGADAVLFPKIDTAGDLLAAVAALERNGAPRDLAVWCMAETPRGIQHIEAIAAASPRLATLVLGTADLGRALRLPADPERTGLQGLLGRCVLAARACGLDILDGVYTELADGEGFARSCRQGRALGFDGRTLIHPGQIATANEVFGVSAAEAAAAAEIIAAWEAAAARGAGIAVADGRMVERLHAEEARRLIALHDLQG